MKKKVIVHSDGACEGNPGPGAWAAVLQHGVHIKEISGAEPATTNNRMELQAAIAALNCIKEPCQVEFFTDSEYLKEGMSRNVAVWKAHGWKRGKKSVKNEDLWKRLDQEAAQHQISWKWLKGHAGHPFNERCDELARTAISAIRRQFTPAQLQEFLAQFQKTRSGESDHGQLF